MEFSFYFPIWNQLDDAQKKLLQQSAVFRQVRKGTVIHNGSENCTGLLLLGSGQLRAYILSDEGREISLGFPVPCYGVLYFTYRSDARRIPHASPDI